MPRDHDDDDDDRPRARRRPNRNDDDEARPRARRQPNRDEVDDDDRPRVRRSSRPDDFEDDYDDRARRRPKSRSKSKMKQNNNIGIISLATGILALVVSFTCLGGIAVVPGLIGLVLGIIGFVAAQKSDGRQSSLLPIGGSVVSLAAMAVSIIAIVSFARTVKEIRNDIRDDAKWEKEEAERKVELAKAATEVKNSVAPIRLTAIQFVRAYVADEDRADALYKNKVLEITGAVEEVDFVNGDDTYTVILTAGEDGQAHCEFAKEASIRARLAQLKPGDKVVIRGKCLGNGPVIEACIFP